MVLAVVACQLLTLDTSVQVTLTLSRTTCCGGLSTINPRYKRPGDFDSVQNYLLWWPVNY